MTATYLPVEQPEPKPAEPAAKNAGRRDQFLDALRAIALTRVIVWHTFGVAVLSWIVATMPIMFFVAGTLLYRSLEGRDAVAVLRKRLRRLLVPFWFFGATVLTVTSLVHIRRGAEQTSLEAGQLAAWIFPLVNPTASGWEAGWASSPLWYLRCYLWILLLSPLLLRAWKLLGYRTLLVAGALTLAAQAIADRTVAGPDSLLWIGGDLALYSIFVLLGFANAEGRLAELSNRDLTEWLLIGAAGAAVAWRFFPSADGVANHSYPTLAALGIAWLAAFALLRPAITRVTRVPAIGTLVRWMTGRAMSIYLWHSPSIVGAYALSDAIGMTPPAGVLLAIVILLTAVMSVATGWIEDIAGGRPAQLWPGRPMPTRTERAGALVSLPSARAVFVGAVATTVLLGLLVQPARAPAANRGADSSGLALPPPPSGRPDPTAAVEVTPASTPVLGDAGLAALIDEWREDHGVDGVTIGVSKADGTRQVLLSGAASDGSALAAADVVPVTSITKTFTAVLILQLRDEGLLDLDDPIPTIDAVPSFQHAGVVTYRQLLDHSSGLAPYQESVGYDAAVGLDAITAIEMAGDTPLQWQPGTIGGYSNSGFLTLGRLIEQLTGESYAAVLQQRLIEPLGLDSTALDTALVGGWVGDSAGGLESSVEDLVTWGDALYRDQSVLSDASFAEMTRIDAMLASGLGTFPVCPCTEEAGTLQATSIGHNGGSVTMQFSTSDGTLVVASFTESFWTADLSQADIYPLLDAIRQGVS